MRIPSNQMLMSVLQVTREGKYVHSGVPRQLVYGIMVYVRQKIVSDASIALSRQFVLQQGIVLFVDNLVHRMVALSPRLQGF